jgi:hypothetical protein
VQCLLNLNDIPIDFSDTRERTVERNFDDFIAVINMSADRLMTEPCITRGIRSEYNCVIHEIEITAGLVAIN